MKDALPLPRVRWRGLTLRLFLITVLPLTALLLAITFGSLALHQDAMRKMVAERNERAVRLAAAALDQQLDYRITAVQALAARATAVASPAQVLDTSMHLLADFDHGLAFIAEDGALLAAIGKGEQLKDALVTADQLADLPAQPNSEPILLAPFAHPESGELILLAMADVVGGGIIAGAFSAANAAQRVLVDTIPATDKVALLVLDGSGQMLYRTGGLALPAPPNHHPGVTEALRGETGTTYLQSEQGEHVVAFTPVARAGWVVVMDELWEAMASPWLRTTQLAPLVLLPVLLLALLALWFGARQIVVPLQALEARAEALGQGDFQTIQNPVGGIPEIRRLQDELIRMAQKVRSAQQSLRAYIGAITAAQEEERRRLARELHDDTMQALVALNQRVQLAQLAQQTGRAEDSLEEIQQLTTQTIENLRRLTRALRPIYLEELGLVAALEMLAREVSQTGDAVVAFRREGVERRLSTDVELALYRIAQEALSNVVRHAEASRASLSIAFEPETVCLTVIDDGQGFAVPATPTELARHGHYGLLGIHERAELIGARLEIRSAPGRGTRLTVSLPVS